MKLINSSIIPSVGLLVAIRF